MFPKLFDFLPVESREGMCMNEENMKKREGIREEEEQRRKKRTEKGEKYPKDASIGFCKKKPISSVAFELVSNLA